MGFKKATESMWWRTSVVASREWVPHWGGSNAEMVGTWEAKAVWTSGTDNRLVLKENVPGWGS